VVSAKNLSQQFVNQENFDVHVRPTVDRLEAITRTLGDALRRGWISDAFPRRLEEVTKEAAPIEYDPLSVRVVRIFGFIQSKGWSVPRLFERLLAPAPEKVSPVIFVGDEWTARAEKQQSLIFQLTTELQELRDSQAEQQAAQTAAKQRTEQGELSEETLAGYRALLAQFGQALLDNSARVRGEARSGKKRQNPAGLRAAVARIVGAPPGASDVELARLLRELAQSVPPE
jgi:hypothetical protein